MPEYHTLIFADAHIRDRRGDEQFALEQIAKATRQYRVKNTVGLGDLLDRQTNRASAVATWKRFMEQIEPDSFIHIRGNHDWDEPSWLECVGSLHLDKAAIMLGSSYLAYFLDYRPMFKLQEELAQIPENCDLLFCHQAWAEWMGDITAPQGEFAQVPAHVRAVVTGDYHKCVIETHKNAGGNDMLVVSPGATCAQSISEPHKHFYILVDDKGAFHRKPLKSRVFIDWPVMNTTEDLERFMAEIEGSLAEAAQKAAAMDLPDALVKPYLRYTFSHSLSDAVRRVEQAVNGRAILYEKELPPAEKLDTGKVAKLAKGEAVTPLSILPQELDQDSEPAAYELITRLLGTTDQAREFAAWRKEQLEDDNAVLQGDQADGGAEE